MMMMKIRLTQIDGKLPNLALMKLSHFYRAQGHEVCFERLLTLK
jgi:aryl carrier-like protein